MSKEVRFSKQVMHSMLRGVNILANTVKVTIGPKGKNVVIDKGFGSPLITNDGVSIAKEIELEDKFENMGAKLVYEVANKTNDIAGDGTTTATILAQSMIQKGLKEVKKGANPVLMREGIELASKKVAEYINEKSKTVSTNEEICNVATISSGSKEIGNYIAEAIEKVGRNGVITVDESNRFETELVVTEGMRYDKGYISPYMVTNDEKMVVELEKPLILITNQKINSFQEILPVLEQIIEVNKPLLLIANDFEQEVISTLVINKMKGIFNVVATKAPGFGENKTELLQDIACLTGTKFYNKDLNMNLAEIKIEELGSAKKVKISKDFTTIINGSGDKSEIEKRINEIQQHKIIAKSDYEKKKFSDRLGNLSNGIAIIKVGGVTETELKEKKLRIEDALNATKAAVSEGIVMGGGVTLVNAYTAIRKDLKSDCKDVQKGIKVVMDSLLKPMEQIAKNAGFNCKKIIKQQMKSKEGIGFDAKKGQWVFMLEEGIIDPTKVTRSAVLNAASISSIFITTEAGISTIESETKEFSTISEIYNK